MLTSTQWARAMKLVFTSNPASVAMEQLSVEQLQRVPFSETEDADESVSVCLRSCHEQMLVASRENQVLPKFFANVHEVIGSVYNAVGGTNSPLIVDTGASCCVTPHRDDFIDGTYQESNVQIKDLSGTNKVGGKGMIRWKIKDSAGRIQMIELEGFHMPKASVRLLSPQCIYHKFGGEGKQDNHKYSIHLRNNITLDAPYNHANLPVLSFVDAATPAGLWTECFGFSSEVRDAWARGTLDERNQNLTVAQRELLLWHQRLSHLPTLTLLQFKISAASDVQLKSKQKMT
jgi:hypothetical protein